MSSEPATKKQKIQPIVKKLVSFDVSNDIECHDIVKSAKCTLVPISLKGGKNAPILLQICGSGRIPKSFGIDVKEVDGNRKTSISLQIESLDDHKELDRHQSHISTLVSEKWSSWYPETKKPSDDIIQSLCNPLVSVRKKKED